MTRIAFIGKQGDSYTLPYPSMLIEPCMSFMRWQSRILCLGLDRSSFHEVSGTAGDLLHAKKRVP